MKFLCVPCDSAMKLQSVGPPESGSLSVVYACPECGYEMAMLTNAYETQVVQSLGVKIGPSTSPEAGASKCPFTAMIPASDHASARPATVDAAQPLPVRWTAAAEARLEKVPSFVRPMARAGIEQFARDNGSSEVDERILDAAKEYFGM